MFGSRVIEGVVMIWDAFNLPRLASFPGSRNSYHDRSGADVRFFFFQAEDGIRDVAVTGVQTCALPICLPEVQLGVLPAAGGCQRLPRLIGARAALDMILAGKVERAQKAFRLGVVDELVPPPILQDITIAAARRMADGWRPRRRRRGGGVIGWLLDGNPVGRRLVFRTARRQVLERTQGHYPAPRSAVRAVG